MIEEREEWRPVLGYEGRYEISSIGRVRSWVGKKVRFLKSNKNTNGYFHLGLYLNGIRKVFEIHKLVAESFLGHERGLGHKIVVDHKNFNKQDNRLCNLRLISNRENVSFRRGTSKYTGVSFSKTMNCWVAHIRPKYRKINLGFHKDEKVCAQWYQDALKSLEEDPTGKSIVTYRKKYSSKYKGVHFDKGNKKWIAILYYNKVQKHIGSYGCETAAYLAREKFINDNNISL